MLATFFRDGVIPVPHPPSSDPPLDALRDWGPLESSKPDILVGGGRIDCCHGRAFRDR